MIRQKVTDKNIQCRAIYAFIILVLMVLVSSTQLQCREIVDMFGKRSSVPDHPHKVFGASPPVTYMLYTIDHSILAGLNFPVREWEKRYLHKSMQDLPVLGGWFGQGGAPNLEMILKINPEIVVKSRYNSAMDDKVDQTLKKISIPVVNIALNTISDYPGAFLCLGQALGRTARAEKLAGYTRKTLSEMAALRASIPFRQKVSVYYAEGVDGLSTECDSSQHAELIGIAGGQNVHQCQTRDLYGMEKISFEQLMIYNPEVMLVMENVFYEKVFSDPLWQRIKAVRNKRVYLIPNQPFNWFDRPPFLHASAGGKMAGRPSVSGIL
jgi:iron complex transport system substrate-binding protein